MAEWDKSVSEIQFIGQELSQEKEQSRTLCGASPAATKPESQTLPSNAGAKVVKAQTKSQQIKDLFQKPPTEIRPSGKLIKQKSLRIKTTRPRGANISELRKCKRTPFRKSTDKNGKTSDIDKNKSDLRTTGKPKRNTQTPTRTEKKASSTAEEGRQAIKTA